MELPSLFAKYHILLDIKQQAFYRTGGKLVLNSKEFNLWADGYDKSVNLSEEANEYPFAGYRKVLGTIYDIVKSENGKNILDIDFGTGILSKKPYDEECSICGIDFSPKMIEIAKQKMPNAVLVQHDFTQGLPVILSDKSFDFIVCTYAIHHLNDFQKIRLIKESISHLSVGGKVLIGDVAFETTKEMRQCKAQSGSHWDADEIYLFVEMLKPAFPFMQFKKASFCSAILSFSK
ncbi:class I SAM-dependent methyltransferase [Ethanoligenens harbinense]|uniref:class I SAM-dependent methyltransferase n=1 Tax=Ethanoligenens harbinense TaxID=253239 RepID=UPI001FA7F578|nr:class I SAM-dependent methyltransferase [Ethanoligenens harbinense]